MPSASTTTCRISIFAPLSRLCAAREVALSVEKLGYNVPSEYASSVASSGPNATTRIFSSDTYPHFFLDVITWSLTMLQRLKGAIDSRIAEEQARAKASGSPATPGLGRSSSQRNSDSPARRPRTRSKVTSVDNGERGIDPAEFEAAFVIEDEDGTPGSTTPATRTGTPKPGEKMEGGESSPPGASEGGMTVGGTPDRRTSPATTDRKSVV